MAVQLQCKLLTTSGWESVEPETRYEALIWGSREQWPGKAVIAAQSATRGDTWVFRHRSGMTPGVTGDSDLAIVTKAGMSVQNAGKLGAKVAKARTYETSQWYHLPSLKPSQTRLHLNNLPDPDDLLSLTFYILQSLYIPGGLSLPEYIEFPRRSGPKHSKRNAAINQLLEAANVDFRVERDYFRVLIPFPKRGPYEVGVFSALNHIDYRILTAPRAIPIQRPAREWWQTLYAIIGREWAPNDEKPNGLEKPTDFGIRSALKQPSLTTQLVGRRQWLVMIKVGGNPPVLVPNETSDGT